jgi:hypothetical protein
VGLTSVNRCRTPCRPPGGGGPPGFGGGGPGPRPGGGGCPAMLKALTNTSSSFPMLTILTIYCTCCARTEPQRRPFVSSHFADRLFGPAAPAVRFLNSPVATFHCTRCTSSWAQACNLIIRGLHYETNISSSHCASCRQPLGRRRRRTTTTTAARERLWFRVWSPTRILQQRHDKSLQLGTERRDERAYPQRRYGGLLSC